MHNKILLVYEDFNELTQLELSLKKIGFDVVGLSTEYSLNEKMISFNPDVVIASGRGPKVSTINVGKKLKEMNRWTGKSLLVFPAGFKPHPQDLIKARMDLILEAPIALPRMIQILAKFTGMQEQALLDKLHKSVAAETDVHRVGGDKSSSSAKSQESVFVKGGEKSEEDVHHASGFHEEQEDAHHSSRFHEDQENVQLKSAKDSFPLDEQKISNKKLDPFEQMKSELSGDVKSQFKFDLSNSEMGEANNKEDRNSPLGQTSSMSDDPSFLSGNVEDEETSSIKGDKGDKSASSVKGKSGTEKSSSITGKVLNSEEASSVASSSVSKESQFPFQREMDLVRRDSAARQKHYDQQLEGVAPLPKKSALADRKSIRKAQKDLVKDWKKTDLEDQDRLRREFTGALFKKTR